MALTWKEKLHAKLINSFGKSKGDRLSKKYTPAFPPSYRDDYSTDISLHDIPYLETLSDTTPLELCFYLTSDPEFPLHLRLYQWQKPISLSDILPILEHFNL